MPQLNQLLLVYQSQWFWLLLVLGIIYFGIARNMVPKIEQVVEDRNARISGDLAAAEKARAEADEAEERARVSDTEAREAAQEIAAKAKAKSAADAEKRVTKADAAIGAKLAEAEASLAEARAQALARLESVAVEAARDIVAKVSGATVSADEAGKVVKAVLANG